jgi:hypothetical protein
MHARRIVGRRLIKDAIANILLKIDSFSRSLPNLGRRENPILGTGETLITLIWPSLQASEAIQRINQNDKFYVSIFLIHDTRH